MATCDYCSETGHQKMTVEFMAEHIPDDWTSVQDLARHLGASHQLSNTYTDAEYGIGNIAGTIMQHKKELEKMKAAEFGEDENHHAMIKSAKSHGVGYEELHTDKVGRMMLSLRGRAITFETDDEDLSEEGAMVKAYYAILEDPKYTEHEKKMFIERVKQKDLVKF